jgi:hypothetical protein
MGNANLLVESGPENSKRIVDGRGPAVRQWARTLKAPPPQLGLMGVELGGGGPSPRGDTFILRCHSTLSLPAIGCHSLGIYTLFLLSLLSVSAEMTVPPAPRPGESGPPPASRDAVDDLLLVTPPPGAARDRSHCRFVLPLIRFIPESLTYSAPLFLKRHCDRTLHHEPFSGTQHLRPYRHFAPHHWLRSMLPMKERSF